MDNIADVIKNILNFIANNKAALVGVAESLVVVINFFKKLIHKPSEPQAKALSQSAFRSTLSIINPLNVFRSVSKWN